MAGVGAEPEGEAFDPGQKGGEGEDKGRYLTSP